MALTNRFQGTFPKALPTLAKPRVPEPSFPSVPEPTSEPDIRPIPEPFPEPIPEPFPEPIPEPVSSPATLKDTRIDTEPTELAPRVEPTGPDTLFNRESPILSVKTIGPRTIRVGKEARFEVTVENAGEVAAEGVMVMSDLPVWTDVVDTQTTAGTVTMNPPTGSAKPLVWRVGRLDAHASRKMILMIVPRKSEPFDLAMRWDYQPTGSQTRIEVQEPKLELLLTGPREVLYGRQQAYQLQVRNTGNGEAEDVRITLRPSGNRSEPIHRTIDTLAPGASKTIEVMLTEWEVGNQTIQVDAQSAGGAKAQVSEKVAVLRAALAVDIKGPELLYVGNKVTYEIEVKNPGTAAAGNVVVSVQLPEGVEYVSSLNNGQPSPDGRQITWQLGGVPAGTQGALAMTCHLKRAGVNTFEVRSKANDDLKASANTQTLVEAMSDLGLNVVDPGRPIRVGTEATFEITVTNEGTRDAENLDVAGFFSYDIEPTGAEGRAHQIGPGQVIFSRIPSLGAGESLTLTIRAKAEKSGHHAFRAEVYCTSLRTRLVSEETTYFYDSTNSHRAPTTSSPTADRSAKSPLRRVQQLSEAYQRQRR